MDADLLQAYLLSQFFHTGGHFYQATNPDNPMRDVSMRLDPKALVENWGEDAEGKLPDRWKPPKKGEPYNALRMSHQDYLNDLNRKATDIHGAGFEMQDRMRGIIDDPEMKKDVSAFNAFIKGLYLSGAVDKMTKSNIPHGDIGGMEKTSGNRHVRGLIAASMLTDFVAYRNPEKNWDVGFSTFGVGAPGLRFNLKY